MSNNASWIKSFLEREAIGQRIEVRGYSGHSVGSPVECECLRILSNHWHRKIWTPDKFWNALIASAPHITGKQRLEYDEKGLTRIGRLDKVQLFLALSRKNQIISKKTDGVKIKVQPNQGATADFLTTDFDSPRKRCLIAGDIKSLSDASSDSNNLISYGKVDTLCDLMMETGLYHSIELLYVGLHFHFVDEVSKDLVEVDGVVVTDIFKENPSHLRPNPSQQQLQTCISNWTQNYEGSREEWCQDFKHHLNYHKRRWLSKLVA